MWNPFRKPPHTRERYEKLEEDVKTRPSRKKWSKGPWGLTSAFIIERGRKELSELRAQGHDEALKLEKQYQKLLEDLEEARKTGKDIEEKEEAVREFEEKKLGMKVDRPHHRGIYR